MTENRFRLVTRSDFDGLVSAILLKELDLIDDIKFVHPKDVQDGLVDIRQGDIITNLPYSKNASYVFDHHISELARVGHKSNSYLNPNAPSAARTGSDDSPLASSIFSASTSGCVASIIGSVVSMMSLTRT